MPFAPYVGPPPQGQFNPVSGYFGGEGWVGNNQNPFSQGAGGRDVYNQFQGIGQGQYQRSQDWEQQFGALSNYYQGLGGEYGQTVGDLYSPIWQGGGGYTPEMQQNILQSQGLQDIQGQMPGNYLTPEEQQHISGDPYAAKNFFGDQARDLTAQTNDYSNDIRQQASAGDVRGQAALSEMRQGYGGALDQLQQGYQSSIDPTRLRLSEGYQPQMDKTLSGARSDVSGAMGDPGLNLTDQYRQQAGMTDQEVDDTATAAARGVGAQFQATKDQLDQDAAASGTATPLGLAAARTALDRSSAASQADALTNARLQARGQQRQAAQGVQGTALQAGQYRAGLGSSNALALEGNDLGARQGAEGMRLGAEQGLSGMQMGAATGLADRSLEATSNLGREAVGQGQYITNAGMGASTQAGNWGLNTGQYNASMGTGLEQSGEAAAQARAQGVAGNRQATNQYNQQTSLGINDTTSGRYQQAYQPWVSAQQEGRAAAQGQQQYYGGQANQQNQFRQSGWQTGAGTQLGAAQGYSGWGSSGGQGFGDYLGKSVAAGLGQAIAGSPGAAVNYLKPPGKASGGLIDSNQLIEVGEGDRPEVILPLDPQTPPEHRNMWERMGSDLGDKMGIKGYAEGGVVGDESDLNARYAEMSFGGHPLPPQNSGFDPGPSQPRPPQQTQQAQPWAANPSAQQPQMPHTGGPDPMPQRPMPMPGYRPQAQPRPMPEAGSPFSGQPAGGTFGRASAPPMPWSSPGGMGAAAPQPSMNRIPQSGSPYPSPGTRSGSFAPSPWDRNGPGYISQARAPRAYGPTGNFGNHPGDGAPGLGNRGAAPSSGSGNVPWETAQQQSTMQQPQHNRGGWGGGFQQPQGFARGGVVGMPKHLGPLQHHPLSGGYRMNSGRHHNPMPMPYSEMGSLGT